MNAPPLIGVWGGRDLAPALADAATAAGVEIRFVEAAADAHGCRAITWLSHTAQLAPLRAINQTAKVIPFLAALEAARDRLLEKQLFKSLGILTAPFAGVESARGIKAATSKFGLPALLKPRLKGGPCVPISAESDFERAWAAVGPLAVVEARVEVEQTFSLSAVRDQSGTTRFWPPEQTVLELEKVARGCLARVLEALKFVGVLSMEFFSVHGGLLAHSLAAGPQGLNQPRALENHLRAVAQLPLVACE